MFQFFLNPMLLAGFAGVALPVVAHLLSRRRFDVVQWGAMQFLDPSRKTRRRMKLEELLLLLVRIGMIALLVLAVSRPWIRSGFLTGYQSGGSRDIVIVIDGSNSMARSDGLMSLHDRAISHATDFLNTLSSGDTVSVIDARDRPISVLDSPLQNMEVVAEHLEQLAPPAGAANLREACEQAASILGRCSNGSREIIVLTDRHRAGWHVDDEASWSRFDDVMQFPAVHPRMWVIDVSQRMTPIRRNISVGQVELSRDLTVPGFPVRFQTIVTNSGDATVEVPLHLLIDGQRLAGRELKVSVPPHAETSVDLEHRFDTEGTHRLTVESGVADDPLSIDNASHAAIRVTSAVPVLLIEGSPDAQSSAAKTFFTRIALSSAENRKPWIVATVVSQDDVTPADIESSAIVVMADVQRLPAQALAALGQFVRQGGGLLASLGTDSDAESFRTLFVDTGLVPQLRLGRSRTVSPDASDSIRILPYSLQSGWLDRFRTREDSSFLKASFTQWWLLEEPDPVNDQGANDGAEPQPTPVGPAAPVAELDVPDPLTLAKLSTGDPALIQIACGEGSVLLYTTTLNTAWNNLPTRPDYVPFLHEAIFQMASSKIARNVSFGSPLMSTIPETLDAKLLPTVRFDGPFGQQYPAEVSETNGEFSAVLPRSVLPGSYQLVAGEQQNSETLDSFVVNYDHGEDVSDELTDIDHDRLIVGDRMTFLDSADVLAQQMYGDESRSELWAFLLWCFVGLLLLEFWMTRRLVLRGHSGLGETAAAT